MEGENVTGLGILYTYTALRYDVDALDLELLHIWLAIHVIPGPRTTIPP